MIISIYTDFDGTVTRASGYRTVNERFYNRLLTLNGISPSPSNYLERTMHTPDIVQQRLEAHFGKYDGKFDHTEDKNQFLMDLKAVEFFHEILVSDNIKLNIVTKNRHDYVKALLKYQGFTDAEIEKVNIISTGDKYIAVKENLSANAPTKLLILDDDFNDYTFMNRAARDAGYDMKDIYGFHEKTGKFQWSIYQNCVREILSQPLVQEHNDHSPNKKDSFSEDPNQWEFGITIKHRNTEFKLTYKNIDTVLQVKEQISKLKGIPVESQNLLCCGVAMRDQVSIGEYRVERMEFLVLSTLSSTATMLPKLESASPQSEINSATESRKHSIPKLATSLAPPAISSNNSISENQDFETLDMTKCTIR